jgi:hypothetical protein
MPRQRRLPVRIVVDLYERASSMGTYFEELGAGVEEEPHRRRPTV